MSETKTFLQYVTERTDGGQQVANDKLVTLRNNEIVLSDPGTLIAPKTNAVFQDNTTETDIPAADTWTVIEEGPLVLGADNGFFTVTLNRLTYQGADRLDFSVINAAISASRVGGGAADKFDMAIFVNGLQVGPHMSASFESGDSHFVGISILHPLSNLDEIDVRIRNVSSDANLVVNDLSVTVVS
jgi:hypothetical protein